MLLDVGRIPHSAEALARLADQIQAVESRSERPPEETPAPIPTGWSFDLPRATLHEWFGPADPDSPPQLSARAAAPEPWFPPLCILTHLARRALMSEAAQGNRGSGGVVVWIGRRCRPYAPILTGRGPGGRELLDRSLFIDPPDDATRLWSIELALRSPAALVVIADGGRLNMAASRRLQLAAKAGRALVLIARPPSDLKELSAAATRWLIRRHPSDSSGPRWAVELLRCKGVQPTQEAPRRLVVEWNRAQSAVVVPAGVVDRPGQEAGPPGRRTA